MKKERAFGIDAVKTAAILLVILLHAGSLSGALGREPLSFAWCLHLYIHELSLACIPLFLITTGFLQNGKTFSASYYRGILPLLVSYLVISALTLICRRAAGESYTFGSALHAILDFSANGYAWYFEMYIGLFLLIPFLNLAYRGIGSFSGKCILLLTLAFLTLMPETLVSFAPYYGGGSANLRILPDFFADGYPIFYYFFGCFLAEYRPKCPRWGRIPLLAVSPILPAVFVYAFTAARGEYAWYMLNSSQSLTTALTALAVFLALYDLQTENRVLRGIVYAVSAATFETYLFSYIADSYVYDRLPLKTPILAGIVFLASLGAAWILRFFCRPVTRFLSAKRQ